MGMFNSIYVECPECHKEVEFQTKSGSCSLASWSIESAPNEEVIGILGDTEKCKCGHYVSVLKEEPEERIRLVIT